MKLIDVRCGESCEFLTLIVDKWSADNAPDVALLSLTTQWIDEKFNWCYAMLYAQNFGVIQQLYLTVA